jgi:hypothetical protein
MYVLLRRVGFIRMLLTPSLLYTRPEEYNISPEYIHQLLFLIDELL